MGSLMKASAIVMAIPESTGDVLKRLITSCLCDVLFYDGEGRIVVTIDSADVQERLDKMRSIRAIPNVISVSMASDCVKDGRQ